MSRAPRRRESLPWASWIALAVLGVIALASIFAPWIAPYDPTDQDLLASRLPPLFFGGDLDHVLGTDANGRDLLSRLIYGGRISLTVGVVAATIAAAIGTTLGISAGFLEGRFGAFVLRLADIQFSIPFYVIAVAVAATLGPGTFHLIALLSFWGWANYARTVAVTATQTKRLDYVAASRMQGAGPVRLLVVHILPRCFGTVTVVWSTMVGSYILVESALSFIGVGIQVPAFSWGSMLAGAQLELSIAWWSAVFPGVVLTIVIVSIYLVGDLLRAKVDPALSRRRPTP